MHFTIITDQMALKELKEKSVLIGQFLRRAEKLLKYNFDIVYCSGKDIIVPDFLSRIYLVELNSQMRIERTKKLQRVKIRILFLS